MVSVYRSVLDPLTIAACTDEVARYAQLPKWACSTMLWPDEIKVGQTGMVTHARVSEELAEQIKKCVAPYMPEHNSLHIQHYLWHKYSGINMHDDSGHRFGATLYLNREWDIAYGGVFIWKDDNGELRAISPEFNTMVVNAKKHHHMVSMVSPLAPVMRYSIQIWGQ